MLKTEWKDREREREIKIDRISWLNQFSSTLLLDNGVIKVLA